MKFVKHRVPGFFKFNMGQNEDILKDGDVVTLEDLRYRVTGTFYTARSGKSGLCVLELIL